jgi:DNA-binding PadR family transcriptional regulator
MFGQRHGGRHGDDDQRPGFGLPARGDDDDGMWAAGRGGSRHGGFGWGGRHGFGGGRHGDDMMRPGRMLGQGDLKLIVLALIADEPRHGYDIIKVLEEKTAGWYAPSPGIVYPTLTYLEEAGHAVGEMEGAKKRYAITDDGRAYLSENRAFADAIMARLSTIGAKMERMNRDRGDRRGEREDGRDLPPLVAAAVRNLREAAVAKLAADADAETHIVEVLARAAADIRRG